MTGGAEGLGGLSRGRGGLDSGGGSVLAPGEGSFHSGGDRALELLHHGADDSLLAGDLGGDGRRISHGPNQEMLRTLSLFVADHYHLGTVWPVVPTLVQALHSPTEPELEEELELENEELDS